MPQPIPSYLMALAVGNLYFEPFGEDTGVYAEPEVLPAAAFEFADTQAMLDAAEAIYGPYQAAVPNEMGTELKGWLSIRD